MFDKKNLNLDVTVKLNVINQTLLKLPRFQRFEILAQFAGTNI